MFVHVINFYIFLVTQLNFAKHLAKLAKLDKWKM